MTELQSGTRLQSSLGTKLTRADGKYKVDTLIIARVASINYQLNTVTFTPMSGSIRAENASQGGNNAVLPMSFAGRNGYGRSYGEVEPIVVGDIILVGYVDSSNTNPIVIGRYPDAAIAKEVTAQRSPSYAPDDVDTYAQSHRKLTVYPDQTYSLHDGSGRMELTFSGNSFVLVNQETNVPSHATDDGDMPVNETNLAGHFDGAWEERTPLDRHAPEIVLRHNGTLDKDGNKDQHELYLYINQDGTYRTSVMNDDQDWRAYFEMTPDGKIRLRRQEDSKIFNSGSKSSELLIDENGYVTVRSQSSGLVVRPDGIYNLDGTKFTSDVDLSNNVDFKKVWDSIDETKDGIKENKAQIEISSHEIATKVSTDELPAAINNQLKPYDDSLKSLKDSYTDVQKTIDNLASDGVISGADKKAVRTIWLQIQTEYPATIAQAEANHVDHTALDGAYTTLKSYLTPILLASGDTTIDSTEWDRDFSNYYNASYNVNTAIVAALRKLAQAGYDKAVTAAEDAGDAITQASEATSEDYLTGSDKATLGHVWIQIQNQYPNDVSSADAVKVDHSALDSAYNDLNAYIQTNNIFANNSTIPIDGETLANKIKAYFKQEASVLKQVADKNIQTLAEYGQDIDHQATSIKETSTKIALSAENIQKHNDSLAVMKGQLNVMANQISGGVSETDVTGIVNDSLSGTGLGHTNQFVLKTATKGQYMDGNNGSSSASTNGIISDYIAVTVETPYSAKVYGATGTVKLSVAWYDSNKSFISGTEQAGTGDVTNNGTAPKNASYAKVSTDDYNFNTLFIAGNAPSEWAPSYADAKGNVNSANQLLKSLTDEQASVNASINANGNKKKTNVYNIGSMFVNGKLGSTDIGSLNGILTDISSDHSSDNSLATQYEVDISALNNYYEQLKDDINGLLGQAEGSSVDIDSYRAKLTDYYTNRDTFLQVVKGKIDSQVSSAKRALSDANNTANEVITNKYANFAITVDGISTKVGEVSETANNAKDAANNAVQKFSEISQTANEIKQTVGEVTTTANNASDKINNLQVGGTNLVLGTMNPVSIKGSNVSNEIIPAYNLVKPMGKLVTQVGSPITISFDYTIMGSLSGEIRVQYIGSTVIPMAPAGHVSNTVLADSKYIGSTATGIDFRLDNFSGTIIISNLKLELGNIATAWSPAPEDNLGIKSTTTIYQLGDSGTTHPTGTWTESVPTLVKGMYLWTRTNLIYTDDSSEPIYSVTYIAKDGNNGADGLPGKDGVGIDSTVIEYAVSLNGVTKPTTGWAPGIPAVEPGHFLWTRTTWSYTDGTSETGYSVAQAGLKGDKGDQGLQGLQGPQGDQGIQGPDGKPSYTHIAYGTSSSGAGLTQTPSASTTYIGMYVDFTATDSNDPSKYAWSLIKGADGADGKDGVPGKAGADGKTPYFHIAYADSGDGNTNFSLDTPGSRKYIGSYTDFTQADSTNHAAYHWQLVQGPKGDTGKDGVAGKNGVGIKSTQIMYAQSTSGTTAPTTGWTAQVPTLIKGQYLWTQTTWVYTDNTGEAGYTVSYNAKDGNDGTNGVAGKEGVGIKSTTITYQSGTSGTVKPTGTWVSNPPSVTAGNYLWTRTIWSYTDGTSETGYSVAKAGESAKTVKVTSAAYPLSPNTIPGVWISGQEVSGISAGSGFNNWGRGHNLVVINKDTFQAETVKNYDDYANPALADTLANDITALVDKVVVVFAIDASSMTTALRNALNSCGGNPDIALYTSNRVAHIFIGMSKDSTGKYPLALRQGYELLYQGDGTNGTLYATQSGFGIATNGASGPQGLQGLQGPQGNQGIQGPVGKSSYTHIAYGTSSTGAGLTQTPSASTTYIGMYVDNVATDSKSASAYKWTLIKGADGSDGLPGKAGADGRTPYFHQAWADSSDGTTNFSTDVSLGKKYLGTYTDYVVDDSKDRTKYKWTELVGAIKIGGTNLYLNSKMITDAYNINGDAKVTVENFNSTTNMWHIVSAQGNGGNVGIFIWDYAKGKVPDNSDWSYSADVKGTGKINIFGIEYSDRNPAVGTIGSEWSRISQTGHVNEPQVKPITMYFDTTSSPLDVYIKLPKLELGNMPTAWSPAPEDNASASDLEKTKETVKTTVAQTAKNWSVLAQGIGGSSAGISVDGDGTVKISGDKLVIGSDLIANDITGKTITGSKFISSFSGVKPGGFGEPVHGTTTMSNGQIVTDAYWDSNNTQTTHVVMDPSGFTSNSYVNGTLMDSIDMSQGMLTLGSNYKATANTPMQRVTSSLDAEKISQLNQTGKLLWSGKTQLGDGQSIKPSLPMTSCLNGWKIGIAVARGNRFSWFLLAKEKALESPGMGHTIPIYDFNAGAGGMYLHVNNDTLFGDSDVNLRGVASSYYIYEIRAF